MTLFNRTTMTIGLALVLSPLAQATEMQAGELPVRRTVTGSPVEPEVVPVAMEPWLDGQTLQKSISPARTNSSRVKGGSWASPPALPSADGTSPAAFIRAAK